MVVSIGMNVYGDNSRIHRRRPVPISCKWVWGCGGSRRSRYPLDAKPDGITDRKPLTADAFMLWGIERMVGPGCLVVSDGQCP